ncbi:hypothetical protein [Streptomyces bauhiniae]
MGPHDDPKESAWWPSARPRLYGRARGTADEPFAGTTIDERMWLEFMHDGAVDFSAFTDADFVTERIIVHPGHGDVLPLVNATLV